MNDPTIHINGNFEVKQTLVTVVVVDVRSLQPMAFEAMLY